MIEALAIFAIYLFYCWSMNAWLNDDDSSKQKKKTDKPGELP